MKKILSIFSAGIVALMALSCAQEKLATFDPANATPPVLGQYSVNEDEGITANFTPAVLNKGFNEKMAVNHVLALVSVNGEPASRILSTKADGNTLTVTAKNLTSSLQGMGFNFGDNVDLKVVVRATMQDPSRDNGINGFVDSEGQISTKWLLAEPKDPNALPAHDGVRVYVDNQTGWSELTLYQWGDVNDFGGGWPGASIAGTETIGGKDWVYFAYGDDIFGLNQNLIFSNNGSDQLADYALTFASDVKDYFLIVSLSGVSAADAPGGGGDFPNVDLSGYAENDAMAGAETWGIIGPAVSDWSVDVDMEKVNDDPEIWCAKNVPFQSDSFKFRGNDEWGAYDLGGGEFGLDTPIVLSQGGGDMTSSLGVYTVYLFPTYMVAYITEGSGDTPPPAPKPTLWSLIGTLNGTSWDTDFDLTNTAGDTWKITNVAITASDEFKIRAEHDWSKSFGGPEENGESIIDESNPYGVYIPTLGQTFNAGGTNIRVAVEGVYDITFNYGAETSTILIEEHKDYPDNLYMTGTDFGGWDWNSDGVVELVPVINNQWGGEATAQWYTIKYLTPGNGFKINGARAWDGGQFGSLETNIGFSNDGDGNVQVETAGVYMIHVDLKRSILLVEPATVYGIGDCFGGWDEAMADALFVQDGKTLKATTKASGSLRMYAASGIDSPSAWWTREFVFLEDGIIQFRTGDELPTHSVGAGQTVILDFNALTGKIEGEAQPEPEYDWALIGWHDNDSWSKNVDLEPVAGFDGWTVAKSLAARADGNSPANLDFKFRKGEKWVPQLGVAEAGSQALNTLIPLLLKAADSDKEPANIHYEGEGTFDVYLNADQLYCVILPAGTAFAVPQGQGGGEELTYNHIFASGDWGVNAEEH